MKKLHLILIVFLMLSPFTMTAQTTNSLPEKREQVKITRYMVMFHVQKQSFSLDISKHIKDSMNAFDMEIPVDKEFYDSVKIGQEIKSDFRVGTAVMKGSFGSNTVTVKTKRTVVETR